MPADHRQARGPAVHLIDLAHDRDAPDAATPLDEAALRLERGDIRRCGCRILLIDLRLAHLLLRGGPCRQQLLVDAGGHLRHILVGVLRDPRLHLGAELGQGVEQPAERFGAEREQRARRERLGAERARYPAKDRHLPEVLAASELCDVFAAGSVSRPQPHATRLNQVQRPGWIPLLEDCLPDVERDQVELGQDDADDRLGRDLGERREVLEEHLQLAVFDLQLQVRPDFRVDVEQRLEHRPIEP